MTATVIFIGALGFVGLLGMLAFGLLLAQILALMLLALAPVFLLAAIVPGVGHRWFERWLIMLGGFLVSKVMFALLIIVTLTISTALAETATLGLWAWIMSAAFYWTLLLKHKAIAASSRAAR